jgi:hypothetical protein
MHKHGRRGGHGRAWGSLRLAFSIAPRYRLLFQAWCRLSLPHALQKTKLGDLRVAFCSMSVQDLKE